MYKVVFLILNILMVSSSRNVGSVIPITVNNYFTNSLKMTLI